MKKETIEIVKYTADDGKTFDTEKECLEYETRMEREAFLDRARSRVGEILIQPEDSIPFIPLDIFLTYNGHIGQARSRMRRNIKNGDCRFYRLRDRQDAAALAAIMADKDIGKAPPESILKESGPMKYPCTVMVSYSYHFERVMGTFLNEMRLVEKYCRMHGYTLKLEPLAEAEKR